MKFNRRMSDFVGYKKCMSSRRWLRDMINDVCIARSAYNDFMPGKLFWQFYLKRGFFNPYFTREVFRLFLREMFDKVKDADFQIAGLEESSIPLLASFPVHAKDVGFKLNAFSIRKERKTYGLLNWLEGIPNDLSVVLIDDVYSSGLSTQKACDILELHNLKPLNEFVVVAKKYSNNDDSLLSSGIKILYLFDLSDFDIR